VGEKGKNTRRGAERQGVSPTGGTWKFKDHQKKKTMVWWTVRKRTYEEGHEKDGIEKKRLRKASTGGKRGWKGTMVCERGRGGARNWWVRRAQRGGGKTDFRETDARKSTWRDSYRKEGLWKCGVTSSHVGSTKERCEKPKNRGTDLGKAANALG